MASKKHLRPKRVHNPSFSRKPRKGAEPESFQQKNVRFSANRMDCAGDWGWHQFENKDLQEFLTKLLGFQEYNIAQLGQQGSHSVEVNLLTKEAKNRLEEISVEEDSLFSLRLTGIKRIWCILNLNTLALLWWDPKHQVCPSHKKHT